MQDRTRHDMQDRELLHAEITETILGGCFEVMNELGSGFLESVYKNALYITLKENRLKVETEKRYEIIYRDKIIGLFVADLVVEDLVIVELKCCETLIGEHQAQLINYPKASGIFIGLLVNFGKRRVEYKRVHHPDHPAARDRANPVLESFDRL